MKKVLLAISFSIVFLSLKAQDKKFSFSLGPVLSSATGDFSKGWGLGIGAEAQATFAINYYFEAFAQTGFQSFSGKTIAGTSLKYSAASHVPFLIGARFKQEAGFIGGLGIGYGTYSTGSGSSSNGFTYSPQIGYNFSKFDLLVHYTSSSVTGEI